MFFRIALPAASIISGIWLFRLGDLQVRKIAILNGGFEEPPQDVLATAKYVHYALNAPAWALLGDTRDWLWSRTDYSTIHHLLYFIAVLLMWTLIGTKIDQRLSARYRRGMPNRWHSEKAIGWALGLFGLFVWYRVLPKWHLLGSISGYLSIFKEYLLAVLRAEHGWWFPVAGFVWGAALLTVGLHLALRSKKKMV